MWSFVLKPVTYLHGIENFKKCWDYLHFTHNLIFMTAYAFISSAITCTHSETFEFWCKMCFNCLYNCNWPRVLECIYDLRGECKVESPQRFFLNFMRVKNSSSKAKWPHIQKLQRKSTLKFCVYHVTADSTIPFQCSVVHGLRCDF